MPTTTSNFGRWILDEYALPQTSLVVSRVLIALWILLIGLPRYLWMSEYPSSFFTPPLGLGLFFESQPSAWFLRLLVWLLATLACLLLAGWRTKAVGVSLVGVILVGNSFDYSFGKINHDILFVALLGCFSFSGWGMKGGEDSQSEPIAGSGARWPFSLLALIVSLGMCAAALPKIATGWLDPDQLSTRGHLIFNLLGTERPTWLGNWMTQTLGAVAWKTVDYGTILLELSFLPAMFCLRRFRFICALAVFFHAGIHFSMDILFWENLLAYGMFVDWTRVLPSGVVAWVHRAGTSGTSRLAVFVSVILGTALTGLYVVVGNPVNAAMGALGISEWAWSSVAMVLMVVLASAYLAQVARELWTLNMGTPPVDPTIAESGPVVLFDGYCGLCDRFVDFVLRKDRKGLIRFAALQSDLGKTILQRQGLSTTYVESVVFVHRGKAMLNSSAALTVLGLLGWPWKLAALFLVVPPVLRDWVYDVVANNRYKWFGQRTTCRLPTPMERERFLA